MSVKSAFNNALKNNRLIPVYRGSGRVIFLVGHSRKPGSRKQRFFKLREEVPLLLVPGSATRVRAVYDPETKDYVPWKEPGSSPGSDAKPVQPEPEAAP